MVLYKDFKNDMIAFLGEFCGTTMFIFLGLGSIKTSVNSQTFAQSQTLAVLSNQTTLYISVGMGLSLLITAWVFYRITGGLFNPAVTLALYLIGALRTVRAILLTIAQCAGGIAGAGLVAVLTPSGAGGGIETTVTKLSPGINIPQGLFLEAFLTAMLVFTVLMLAAEKHKATFMAPIGIGLTLFVCQLFGTLWTGCGMNPARSLGSSVIAAEFPGYHWIYWAGPLIGSLIATGFYSLLKIFDYGSVVLGQDADTETGPPRQNLPQRVWHAKMGFTRDQRKAMLASGMRAEDLERAEAQMVAGAGSPSMPQSPSGFTAHPGGRHPSYRNSQQTAVDRPMFEKANGHTPATQTTPVMAQRATMQRNNTGMGADAQGHGGLAAPGAHGTGLTAIPIVKKVIQHKGNKNENAL